MGILKWFSFGWLSSAERKELEKLRAEKKQREEFNKEIEEEISRIEPILLPPEKPYKSMFFNGTSATVVLNNDAIWTNDCTKEAYLSMQNCTTRDEILDILFPKVETPSKREEVIEKEEQEAEEILSSPEIVDVFVENGDFEYKEGVLYMKGSPLPLPASIKSTFLEIIEKRELNIFRGKSKDFSSEYEALKMFWLKLSLNPVASSREDLIKFITYNNIKITNTGNFIGYRRIVSVNSNVDKSLVEFISASYLKVKGWKKAAKNYDIYNDNGLVLHESKKKHTYNKHVGNLKELYDNITNMTENRFTDKHTKKYDIRIGAIYRINENDLDLTSYYKSCGGALHVSDGRNYDYKGFGDVPVVVIINPMHVVKMDTGTRGKIGVREMFIAAKTTFKNNEYVDIDDKSLVHFDDEYNRLSYEELEQMIAKQDFSNLDVEKYKVEIKKEEIVDIAAILKSRMVKI